MKLIVFMSSKNKLT